MRVVIKKDDNTLAEILDIDEQYEVATRLVCGDGLRVAGESYTVRDRELRIGNNRLILRVE